MEPELAKEVNDFHKTVASSGEDIIFRRFPKKILELHQLIQTTAAPDSPFHILHAERSTDTTIYPPSIEPLLNGPGPKKRRREDEIDTTISSRATGDVSNFRIVANEHMSKNVHNTVKQESQQLAAMIDDVKLWVTLTMPKIEDGDNFGVQIQEEVLTELHRAQESAYNLRDTARQDYLARAKICSKIIKYPHVEDYCLALKEHDEKQLYLARQHLLDLRNMYAVLADLVQKNISKIRAPKANNSVGLY